MSTTLLANYDWSKYGQDSATGTGLDPTTYFDNAVAEMEADAWSKDAVALGDVKYTLTLDWSGALPHLRADGPAVSNTGHLGRDFSTGHLKRYEPYVSYVLAETVALADSYNSLSVSGDTATSIQLYMSSPAAFPSGIYCRIAFRVTASETPDDAWTWVTDAPVYELSVTSTPTWYTFTTNFVLGSWLWVVSSFSEYTTPTVPLTETMTNSVTYRFSVGNTIKIN